jgi:hypothetical protein
MKQFKNIFLNLGSSIGIDFNQLVEVRRAKLIHEGFNVDSVNWEHYAKVLEAKREGFKM